MKDHESGREQADPRQLALVYEHGGAVNPLGGIEYRRGPHGLGMSASQLNEMLGGLPTGAMVWLDTSTSNASENEPPEQLVFYGGGIVLDRKQQLLFVDEQPVEVIPLPYAFLRSLMQDSDRVISREDMFSRLWPGEGGEGRVNKPQSDRLSAIAKRAREMLGDKYRRTVATRGSLGYMFNSRLQSRELY